MCSLAGVLRLLGLLRGPRGKGRGRASCRGQFVFQLDWNRAGPAFSFRWSESPDPRNAILVWTLHAGLAKKSRLKPGQLCDECKCEGSRPDDAPMTNEAERLFNLNGA